MWKKEEKKVIVAHTNTCHPRAAVLPFHTVTPTPTPPSPSYTSTSTASSYLHTFLLAQNTHLRALKWPPTHTQTLTF